MGERFRASLAALPHDDAPAHSRLRRALLRQVDQMLPHIRMPIQVVDDVGAAALGLDLACSCWCRSGCRFRYESMELPTV